MARSGLIPSFSCFCNSLSGRGELAGWLGRARLTPFSSGGQLWLCVCMREAWTAGRGSSRGPEQLQLILLSFLGTGLWRSLLPSDLSLRPDLLRS